MNAGALPRRIGRYDIQKELGRGMMGVVYHARDAVLQRNVALKTISLNFATSATERENFEARFLQEARAAAGLAHPAIVVVYEAGVDQEAGSLFIALEFLRGKTLEAVLAAGQALDWREALRTTARLADALHHAHSRKIVHRDIKPANLMILPSGEPKILDFGVAKLEAAQLTLGGQVFGSPSYMSPEQADGQKLDGRSDLFSLGSVLYEMLTGTKAFPGRDLPTILRRVASEEPAPPTAARKGIPPVVDALVARALAKQPAKRYPDGRAFAEDLEDVLANRPPRHLAAPGPATVPKAKPSAVVPHPGEGTVRGEGGQGVGTSLPAGKRVAIAFLSGLRRGEMFVLSRPTALIGRAGGRAAADIELTDPEVSRTHALIECHGSRFVLRDLGSTNGTFVDDSRIQERAIDERMEFRVGATRMRLVVSDEG